MTRLRPIHYAGRLVILNFRAERVTHIGQGWAACCSGDRAIAIRNRGDNTLDRSAVTCKSCLRQIERADFTRRMRPDITHMADGP